MINLAAAFSRRPAPSPAAPAQLPPVDEARERAFAERMARLVAWEQDLVRRERRLLEAEAVLTRQGFAGPSQSIPGLDISSRIDAFDLSAAPRSREESRARAELILAVGRKFGSPVVATPIPDVARDPVVQEALRVLDQQQASARTARAERETEARAQADAAVAVGRKFGSRVLANGE
jgi:hypothetical protein